jgi:hypothetical protein
MDKELKMNDYFAQFKGGETEGKNVRPFADYRKPYKEGSPYPFSDQMDELNDLIEKSKAVEDNRKAIQDRMFIGSAVGDVVSAFSRPSVTASEIMVGREPKDYSDKIKQNILMPAMLAQRGEDQKMQDYNQQYKQQMSLAQLLSEYMQNEAQAEALGGRMEIEQNRFYEGLNEAARARKFESEENRKDRDARLKGIVAAIQGRKDIAGLEGNVTVGKGTVTPVGTNAEVLPGYKSSGKFKIRDVDLSKFADSVATTNALKETTEKLNALFKQHGTEAYGPVKAQMEQLVVDAQMQLKDLQRLGVLTGPDMGLLMKQLPDPTSPSQNVRALGNFALGDEIGPKFDAFPSLLDSKLRAKADALGLEKVDGDFKKVIPMGERRQRGGKTYEKVEGGWKEVK